MKLPLMWGSSIVGFGSYHYKYASGREGDWMLAAFSPRKQNITLYIWPGFEGYSADAQETHQGLRQAHAQDQSAR